MNESTIREGSLLFLVLKMLLATVHYICISRGAVVIHDVPRATNGIVKLGIQEMRWAPVWYSSLSLSVRRERFWGTWIWHRWADLYKIKGRAMVAIKGKPNQTKQSQAKHKGKPSRTHPKPPNHFVPFKVLRFEGWLHYRRYPTRWHC